MVDETPAVDESQTVDGSELKTTESTQEAVKTHLNVGAHATKSSPVTTQRRNWAIIEF